MRCTAPRQRLRASVRRLMCDQITPVLAYRRLVGPDERTAPSFLFESVETGGRAGRHSMLGARPAAEIVVRGREVTVVDHRSAATRRFESADPLAAIAELAGAFEVVERAGAMPTCFRGGWVGYVGYDSVRWMEPEKLPFERAPRDDRALPELHLGLYPEVVIFDHVDKTMAIVVHEPLEGDSAAGFLSLGSSGAVSAARDAAVSAEARLDAIEARLERDEVLLRGGAIDIDLAARPRTPARSSLSQAAFEEAVRRAQEYIAAGDIFQVVLSQRLVRTTKADPFDIYRALRIVNPSPYQIYLQAAGAILVAASPEILCRVRGGTVVSRPLAGTRPRGADEAADLRLERELLADGKERAEHIMLVDLGRNDLGRIARAGSVAIERCMEVERYSHVMHISSTLTAALADGLDCWSALRSSLPVGTVSGAPKVRAMQVIDELEPIRRGPYGGGIGCVGFDGDMDMALALRTMVVPTSPPAAEERSEQGGSAPARRDEAASRRWTVHLQAGAGIVAESVPQREYEETLSKAAALGRAIDLAEVAFADPPRA
ncbi:MAG TPA: chorismate-binding protein [Phycisphaerales bacterium]|nr:chorismate-binding protein [Phycisphaerales bacterium]HMP36812.1 chorismate-binding protein [Phycisphaerales bacterium]